MTKAKKVLSIVLAVVMVAAMFAFSVGAAPDQNATFTVSVDSTPVQIGDVINVTVNLTTDYYAGPTNVPVYYDTAVFEFVAGSVTGAKIFGATATDVQYYNDAATGCLKVAFIPDASDGTAAAKMLNGTLFTFQLKAIANGTSDIGLKADDQKTSTNIGGTLYCGAYATTSITSDVDTVDQTLTINNTSATVGAAATPELAVIDGTTGVIDSANKYVYGVTAGDAATLYFEATNGGSVKMVANEAGADNGTGATLQLIDVDGTTVLDTYTLVIFGDVNGDGAITMADYGSIKNVVLGDSIDGALAFAADVTGDGEITMADYATVKNHVLGSDITVNPFA